MAGNLSSLPCSKFDILLLNTLGDIEMTDDTYLSKQNSDQEKYWNSEAGKNWVNFQDGLDHLLEAVNARLMQSANIKPGENVLDIGGGTGATTYILASLVGPNGHVVGLDIS